MRRLVYILGFTTALFLALSIYFANELRIEREHPVVAEPAKPAAPSVAARGATPPPMSAPAASPPTAAADSSGGSASSRAEWRAREAEFLAEMADPVNRYNLIAEEKLNVRARSPRLAQHLGMTDEEYDQLLELLAEQALGSRETHARCIVDPDCNSRGLETAQSDARERDLAALLGPERRQRYAEWRETLQERKAVTSLRANLSDKLYMTEQRAEELIVALADERNRIQQESVKRGVGVASIGNETGTLYADADARTHAALLESARRYSARLRERASGVLTPEQLRVFNRMQDELLAGMGDEFRRMQGVDRMDAE